MPPGIGYPPAPNKMSYRDEYSQLQQDWFRWLNEDIGAGLNPNIYPTAFPRPNDVRSFSLPAPQTEQLPVQQGSPQFQYPAPLPGGAIAASATEPIVQPMGRQQATLPPGPPAGIGLPMQMLIPEMVHQNVPLPLMSSQAQQAYQDRLMSRRYAIPKKQYTPRSRASR